MEGGQKRETGAVWWRLAEVGDYGSHPGITAGSRLVIPPPAQPGAQGMIAGQLHRRGVAGLSAA
jgi:hypothetical protein